MCIRDRVHTTNQQFDLKSLSAKVTRCRFSESRSCYDQGYRGFLQFFASEGESDRLYLAEKRPKASKIVSEA